MTPEGAGDSWQDPTDASDARQGIPRGVKILIALVIAAGFCCLAGTLLPAILLPSVTAKLDQARRAQARADLALLADALDRYAVEAAGAYPERLAELEPYVPRAIPLDPWGRAYVYRAPTPERPAPEVLSFGADGAPGGEGLDADVLLDER